MAVVVLVLWLFTAGAGVYLLATSTLGRARPAATTQAARPAPASVAAQPAPAAQPGPDAPSAPASPRDTKRAARHRFDPPSLVAARNAPLVPGARALLEFAHPVSGLIGFGFWLGFTFVHNRALGWIAFGLIAVTASLGLTWFAANTRAAERPTFSARLIAVHGGAAAVTVALAALAVLVLKA